MNHKTEQGINLITTLTHLIHCQNQLRASQPNKEHANQKPTCYCLQNLFNSHSTQHSTFQKNKKKNFTHSHAADDAGLIDDTSVQECVFHTHHDVCGNPVIGGLVDVRSRGVRVVASRRWSSRSHGTVPYRTGTRTGLRSTIQY